MDHIIFQDWSYVPHYVRNLLYIVAHEIVHDTGFREYCQIYIQMKPKHNHWKIKLSVRTNSKVLGINFPMSITMSFSIHYLREIYMYSKHISHRLYIEKHEMQVQHALE